MRSSSKLERIVLRVFRKMEALTRGQQCLFPPGHFYSPVPDLIEIKSRESEIWAARKEMAAIDWNECGQLALLRDVFPRYVTDIDFPVESPGNGTVYYYQNDQFPILDAEVLYCVLRHFQPARMIEIGSGFSSLVTAEVNRIYLGNRLHFTCIEPYPRQFLLDGIEGIDELVIEKIQDVPAGYFKCLNEGDVLFIDSSHVSKVGSDVNYLFFDILPRLNKGVMIHIHDIFFPDDYPKKWVIEEGRHWNEQYLVRAFLEFNNTFEICWASHFMAKFHGEKVASVFLRYPSLGGGGSLWLRKKG